jgi:hypothetical protein
VSHDHILVSTFLHSRPVAGGGAMCASARRRVACLVALSVALLSLAPPAAGAIKTWADGTGQWDTAGLLHPSISVDPRPLTKYRDLTIRPDRSRGKAECPSFLSHGNTDNKQSIDMVLELVKLTTHKPD